MELSGVYSLDIVKYESRVYTRYIKGHKMRLIAETTDLPACNKRLIKFIEKNRMLTHHQYGFRENRSTELAIIELTNKLTKAIDSGEFIIGIFLDLSKAFDTINHTGF